LYNGGGNAVIILYEYVMYRVIEKSKLKESIHVLKLIQL
jgi:hypothetical protein